MSKKTASGLGTYITDYKVTDLIEVYRMDGLLAPNAVALAGVVATQTKNNTVRSAIVYENLPGIFDNPSDMPKIYLFGATERQQKLFDKIITEGRNDPQFIANFRTIAQANPNGIFIVVSNSSSLPTVTGGLVGGMAQPGPLTGGNFGPTMTDGQFELQAGDIGRSDVLATFDTAIRDAERLKRSMGSAWTSEHQKLLDENYRRRGVIEQEASVYFARHVIHEMFHWGAKHNSFGVPQSPEGMTALMNGWTDEAILNIALTDPTYGPSDQILRNLQVKLNLDAATINSVLQQEQKSYGTSQLNSFKNALYRFYKIAVSNPAITLTGEQLKQLVVRGVLVLRA